MAEAAVPLKIAGTLLGVAGSLSAGSASASASRANAATAREDALLALEDAEAGERATRINTAKLISAQRAAAGASGSALSGSAILFMTEAAIEGELEAQGIHRRGEIAARRLRRLGGAFEDVAAAASIGGALGAGAQIFGGAAALAEGL